MSHPKQSYIGMGEGRSRGWENKASLSSLFWREHNSLTGRGSLRSAEKRKEQRVDYFSKVKPWEAVGVC